MQTPREQENDFSRISFVLLLLGTTAASLLGQLDALLVGLEVCVAAAHHAAEAGGGLPGTLELAGGGLAEDVDFHEVALEGALEGDDGLDEERVGVLEVQVHDAHHADAHELRLEEAAQLRLVVGVHGGGDDLGLLGAAHGRGLDVLEDGHVCEEIKMLVKALVATRASV
jgi:hypothetical protein